MKKIGILLLILTLQEAYADVTLDGSLSGNFGDAVASGDGFDFNITEDLGQVSGTNLFHSFDQFSLNSGEAARFSSTVSIDHVIARVTGDGISTIDGEISSSIDGASFWFFNPNGVVLGEDASLNFDGEVTIGSFDTLRFGDGTTFAAELSQGALLSIDSPAAFGFLNQANPGDIVVNDANLVMGAGNTFRLVGADINLTDSTIDLEAGAIELLAGGSFSDFISQGSNLEQDVSEFGTVSLSDSTRIDVSGPIGGNIAIVAGEISASDSLILSESESDFEQGMARGLVSFRSRTTSLNDAEVVTSAKPGFAEGDTVANLVSDISFISDEEISLEGRFAFVFSNAFSDGASGGAVVLDAPNVSLDRATVSVSSRNDSTGSSLLIRSGQLILENSADITADTSLGSAPSGLDIEVDHLILDTGSTISADGFGTSAGIEIDIDAQNLTMRGQSEIAGQTTDNSGGGISIDLSGDLVMDEESNITSENFGIGDGADITIQARNIDMSGGSEINASALNIGDGGDVRISVIDTLNMVGTLGTESEGQTEISSKSGNVERELLPNGAPGLIDNEGYGEGSGGSVLITGRQLNLSDGASITSSAERSDAFIELFGDSPTNVGDAGSINIGLESDLWERLEMSSDSSITTRAPFTTGGNIALYVKDYIEIRDSSVIAEAGGVSEDNAGGNIFIDPDLLLFNNATINANANAGNGGNITIIANNIIQDPSTQITASSNQGVDGAIEVSGVTNDVSSLEALNVSFAPVNDLLRSKCNIQSVADRSSFVVVAEQSQSAVPGEFTSSGRGEPLAIKTNFDDIAKISCI